MTIPRRAGAGLRLLRAAVFSAVCVSLSAGGHMVASGSGVPAWALLAGWVVVLCVAAALAGRERSLPAIAGVLLGGELGLHLLFSVAQGPHTLAPAARHTMSGMVSAADGAPPVMSTTSVSMMFTPAMLCAHVIAAIVLGWVLRRGEVALWRIVRLSAQRVSHLAALLGLSVLSAAIRAAGLIAGLLERQPSGVHAHRAMAEFRVPKSVALRHSVIRRGPPTVTLAA